MIGQQHAFFVKLQTIMGDLSGAGVFFIVFSFLILLVAYPVLQRWKVIRKERNIAKDLTQWASAHNCQYLNGRVRWNKRNFPTFDYFFKFCSGMWYDLNQSHRIQGNWQGFDFFACTVDFTQITESEYLRSNHTRVIILHAGKQDGARKRPKLPSDWHMEMKDDYVLLAHEGKITWSADSLTYGLNLITDMLAKRESNLNVS